VASLGVVAFTPVSSTLPATLSFELNLSAKQGRLSGTTPKEGGSWAIVYNLFDKNKCPVIKLTVKISTAAATGCPQVQSLRWDFGEVSVGTQVFTAKAIPSDILSKIRSAGIVKIAKISSNLPSGAELNLDLGQGIGVLTGNLPTSGASYEVLFGLYDNRNCEIYRLSVTLHTAQARGPELSVQIVKISVEKVCDKDYSHALTVYWQASGGVAPISVGPLSVVYPDGRTQAVVGTFPASGSATLRVNLSSGGKVKVRVQANDSAGHTKTAEQEQSLDACVQIIGPIIVRPIAYTLEVFARRPTGTTPGYEELKVPVRISGETTDRITPFTASFGAGTSVTLRFPYRIAGGAYGRQLMYFDVYVGDATTPTRQNGVLDARKEYVTLTITMSAKVRIIAWYQDIIG
jgi:hypothetical protein